MSDRDLLALIVIVVIAAAISTFDLLLDLKPNGSDGVLNAALLIGALLFVYKLGKSSRD